MSKKEEKIQMACPNCGSYINPEDYETDIGARMTSPEEFTCNVCHHKLGTIVWCLMPAKYMEMMNR